MDATSTSAQRPHKLSLITGRWHTSSRVVLVLVLLTLLFSNVPGQSVRRLRYEGGGPFYMLCQYDHGWPLTYLIRIDPSGNYHRYGPIPQPTVRDCFALWQQRLEFDFWPLAANLCVALLATFASGLAFEAWRRQRRRIWQVHLRDYFAAILVLSLVLAWCVYAQRRHAAEQAILDQRTGDGGHLTRQVNQEGGITWLRRCVGEQLFQWLDRPFEVAVAEGDDWSQLEKLPSVVSVEVQVYGTTKGLGHLARVPRLEALYLADPIYYDDNFVNLLGSPPDNVVAELPPLPNLRGLYVGQPAHKCRRIDRLTSLEAIRIGERCIDDEALREISALPNLRELSLDGLSHTADLSFLPSLPRLAALSFYYGEISASSLKHIGRCAHLLELSLYMCRVDGHGIRYLSGLANLETLNLSYTNVTSPDLAELGSLTQLRELDLGNTNVDGNLHFLSSLENLETLSLYDAKLTATDLTYLAGLNQLRSLDLGYAHIRADGRSYLRELKQLRWLRLSNYDKDELNELRAALPDCRIVLH
jgi:hypothetical protein